MASAIISAAGTIMLARILAPREYGLAGLVLVFSSMVLILSSSGLGTALVQKRALSEVDRSTAFWISVAVGVLLLLVGLAAAEPLALALAQPRIAALFAVASLAFPISAAATTAGSLLVRDLRFRELEIRTLVSLTAGVIVALALALAGAGAWAVIAQQLTHTTVSTALLWRSSPWRPRRVFSRESLRNQAGFNARVFGAQGLQYVTGNADNILVGRVLGTTPLGVYALSYSMMLLPVRRIVTPLQDVFFSAMSRMDDRAAAGRLWLRAAGAIAVVCCPVLAAVIVVMPDLVRTLLGPAWTDATVTAQVLGWAAMLQVVQVVNPSILQAVDETRLLFRFSLLFAMCSVTGFVVGLHWGVVGVAASYAVVSTVLQPLFMFLTARAAHVKGRRIIAALIPGVACAVAVGGAALVARGAGLALEVGPGWRLAIALAAGTASGAAVVSRAGRVVLADLRDLTRPTAVGRRSALDPGVQP